MIEQGLLVKHGKMSQNFLTRPKKYLIRARILTRSKNGLTRDLIRGSGQLDPTLDLNHFLYIFFGKKIKLRQY